MDYLDYRNLPELDTLKDTWECLSEREPTFVPSFSELRAQLETSGAKFRILVAADNSQVVAIACFVYGNGIKRYSIGERKLFDLPVKEIALFGSCVLGKADESVFEHL